MPPDEQVAAELTAAHKCYRRVARLQQEQDWRLTDPNYETWLKAKYEEYHAH